jgi:hypothetical protein
LGVVDKSFNLLGHEEVFFGVIGGGGNDIVSTVGSISTVESKFVFLASFDILKYPL